MDNHEYMVYLSLHQFETPALTMTCMDIYHCLVLLLVKTCEPLPHLPPLTACPCYEYT